MNEIDPTVRRALEKSKEPNAPLCLHCMEQIAAAEKRISSQEVRLARLVLKIEELLELTYDMRDNGK